MPHERLRRPRTATMSHRVGVRRSAAALILGAWCGLVAPSATGAEIEFYRDVYPILKSNCIACHNKTTHKAALNMESPESMRKGGDSGEGIIPGKGAESLIYQAAAHIDDLEMPPPNNKSGAVNLTPDELTLLKTWIDQGARASVQQARRVEWQPLPPGVHPIYSVAMTRDGQLAACGRANQVFVYDLSTRQLAARLADPSGSSGVAHRAIVQSLAFSPDGMRLASGSFREVKIWRRDDPVTVWCGADPKLGVIISALSTGHKGAGGTITALETGKELLIAASADGKVHLWKAPYDGPARVLSIPGVAALALSEDGHRLATGRDDGVVQIWDVAAGKPIIDLKGDAETENRLADLAWSVAAQGLEMAFQKQETSRLEAQNRGLDDLLKKTNETIATIKKDLDAKRDALKKATQAREAASKPQEAEEKRKAEDTARSALMAREIHLKDAEASARSYTEARSRNEKAIAAAGAAASKAKEAQDRATSDAAALRKAEASKKIRPLAVRFSVDGQTVASVMSDGSMRAWAVASGRPVRYREGRGPTNSASLSAGADGVFVASVADGSTIRVGTASRWTLERTLGGETAASPFADRVNALRFSPDGKTLAVGGGEPTRSGDISLWDVGSGRMIGEWKERHADAVLGLDFSPDGKRLASGGADRIARVTDIDSGKVVHLFEGHTHHVLGVTFRADGRMLATAGGDGAVILWDMISGERARKVEGWTKEVTSIQFLGASNRILTSAGDPQVRIVNDGGGQVRAIAGLPDFMQSAAGSADGRLIVGGGEDGVLRLWDGANGQQIAAFGAEAKSKGP